MKRAFTLIEVIISIAIFALIALYMYQAINTVQKSNDINTKHYEADKNEQKIIKLFYNDLFAQVNVSAQANIIKGDDFDVFYLHSRNSLHAMYNPQITYFVKDNTLYRIESKEQETIPLTYDSVERVKVDRLVNNVSVFRIYESKNSYLINYKDDTKLTSFQISLPPSNSTNSRENRSNDPTRNSDGTVKILGDT
ncbi:MAG: prepilin-type N-terminal cleavage/methylation domain-containing protein [Campylobacteraceae bacterium]|nr:prepilin-type N-terminal cleavage/methylation domain-containing protein [Campylobacteraceae bacterium]